MAELKVFLGYAPGVGKTYTMLNEGNRRLRRGENVIIGYLEHHNRKDTIEQIGKLEFIPLKEIIHEGKKFYEMNLEEILTKSPELVLIDELAHSNLPSAKNTKRYLDVLELLQNDISVYTTLNLQHLESLNDIVQKITGIKINETVPDNIIDNATVVIVDVNPDALRNRIKRGDVYTQNLIYSSLHNFFRLGNLTALRELTLRRLADEVDEDLEKYKFEHNLNENWQTVERIGVLISSSPSSKKLIRTGARISKKYKCEFYCIYVESTHSFAPKLLPNQLKSLDENISLAEKLHGQVILLQSSSISKEISRFVKSKFITKIIVGHSQRTFLQKVFRGSLINELLKELKDIEVIILPY